MDRIPRELQRFCQTLRSLVAFVLLVIAFVCISFLSVLRTWFRETRTAFQTYVSRRAENAQPLTSREGNSLTNSTVLSRIMNWQRMRESLESFVAFTALSSTVAFFCSLFAISDSFDAIGRPAWDIAFHQEKPSTSSPTNGSLPELEGLALRMGESFEIRQMMLSVNLAESISSKCQSKDISQSHNHPSPQKRRLESCPTLPSETSPNYVDNQEKLNRDRSKKFRPSNEVPIKSSPKESSPIEFKANLNECFTPETLKNDNPQEGSTPVNSSDINRRKKEESRQERSVRQISSSTSYRINEGAGPSSQPDSVPWQEISRRQDTIKTGKSKSEKSTQTYSSPEKVIRKKKFRPKKSPPPPVRPLYSLSYIAQKEAENLQQSTTNFQHGNAEFQKSFASIRWDRVILPGGHPRYSDYRRKLFSSPASSKAQSPSLRGQHASIRNRGSPYQLPSDRSSHKSPERSCDENAHHLESPYTISLPSVPPTANPKSPVWPQEETLNKQESSTSLETSNDKQPSCVSQRANIIVSGSSSNVMGTVINRNVHKEYLDGSRGESKPLQGSSNNSVTYDGSKPGGKSPERSQQESSMIRCSSSNFESPNKEFSELSMNENEVQNLETSYLNTGLNTRHQSSEKYVDQQHIVSEKSTEEGTKNPEILDSSKILREETALTKVVELKNDTENPASSSSGINVLQFPFEIKAEESIQRDSDEEAVSLDLNSDKCKEYSPSEIEEGDGLSSESLEEGVEKPF